MKYLLPFRLLSFGLLIGSLLFTACQKEQVVDPETNEETIEENEEPVEEVANSMTALIDSTEWEADNIIVTMKDGVINITAVSADEREITITVQADSEGEYNLNLVSPHVALYTPKKNETTVFSSNGDSSAGGSVEFKTINLSDKELSGTFEFKAVPPGGGSALVRITEGRLTKVKIQ